MIATAAGLGRGGHVAGFRRFAGRIALLSLFAVGPGLAAEQPDRKFSALDRLEASAVPVALKFPEAKLPQVLQVLAYVGGYTVEFRGQRPDVVLSVDWKNLTIKEALVRLGREHSLHFEVPRPDRLVVWIDVPAVPR